MKKIIVFVLVIFAGLSLVSCEKDDNGKSLLAGNWKVTDFVLIDSRAQKVPSSDFTKVLLIECNRTLILTENGEFDEQGACSEIVPVVLDREPKGKYTTNGIFITFKNANESREFSYSVTSTTLKLTFTPEGKVGTDEGAYSFVATFTKQ